MNLGGEGVNSQMYNSYVNQNQGEYNAGLDNVMQELRKSKTIVAGIYGAGGEEASGNPDLKRLVNKLGGTMFTSTLGCGDYDILQYLEGGYNAGKEIIIYGHSRGGAAAVRIANTLGAMHINIAEINLYDPVGFYGGGDFVFEYPNVMKVNNYYQRNPTDYGPSARYGELPDNPFQGSPVSGNFQWPVINNVNLTGQYYSPGVLMNHINITRYAIKHP
ncbi:hypothetical protein [Flavobacterium piscis]|uniref:Fungal lipase-like domain-containing protein n=1 Tax=Flavobacterium piscis TaxID=1114874 RepID=A0ABU1Y5X1_9FLAO|nr:hypothetical protein [Flavobacterium piscis]MDR7209618.1 hypothetical protein [Flavobacterium piscis]